MKKTYEVFVDKVIYKSTSVQVFAESKKAAEKQVADNFPESVRTAEEDWFHNPLYLENPKFKVSYSVEVENEDIH